jgi:putative thioredoxin
MTLPPNFGQAFDLSNLGKPKADTSSPLPGLEVTAQNLSTEILPLSATKPVFVICWSARSAESVEMIRILGKMALADQGTWILTRVDIDTQPQVAQALQTQTVPYGLVFIANQPIPFTEQALNESQLREVITKVLTLASQQGIGEAPVEQAEPEEEEALTALEAGNFAVAEDAYKRLLARKPSDPYALIGLTQVQLLIRTEKINPDEVLAAVASQPENIEVAIQAADVMILQGDVEGAFGLLINLIAKNQGDDRKVLKERLLELFGLIDAQDPRLIKARATLANVLF